MKENSPLYEVVDYILNHASPADLDVIQEAVNRRETEAAKGGGSLNPLNIDTEGIARTMSDSIQQQVGGSLKDLRSMIRGYAVEVIKKEAPELEEDQLKELLDTWIPEDGGASRPQKESPLVPEDVLMKMIDQFLRYSTGQMSVDEQSALHEDIPDWQDRYWQTLPVKIRGLVSLYLKGKLDAETAMRQIRKELDLLYRT